VPTKDSVLGLAELMADGFTDIQRFAVPVPAGTGITLLTCGGVGLIAICVDFLAVRLRRAALAGLPLLSLFVVPASFLGDPLGWWVIVLGALGFLGLLVADGRERVGRWGRTVLVRRAPSFVAPRPADDPSALRLSGKRVGFTAIALAILLPSLLPTLEPDPLFGFGVGGGKGGSGNAVSFPNPVANLRRELSLPANSTVLTYLTSDNSPRYLRLYSLDVFDGAQWTMTEPTGRPEDRTSAGPLPPAPGQSPSVPAPQVTTRITVSEEVRDLKFLPLPYPPGAIRIDGDWRPDRETLMVFSHTDTAGGATYEVVSAEPRPTAAMLKAAGPAPEAIREKYLPLPDDLPSEIRRLAEEETRQGATPYEKAILLQEFFTTRGGFTYSLAAQGHDGSALVDFLTRSRSGYCEQFAASMAVLARVLGIPSRVAIGYTGGGSVSGRWNVRTHDSHAWPELYFEGAGWLRFEPTPSGPTGQASASRPAHTFPEVLTDRGDEPSAAPSAGPAGADPSNGPAAARRNPMLDRDFGGAPLAVDEGVPTAAKAGIGTAAVLLVLLIPALLGLGTRRRRRRVYSRESVPARSSSAPGAGGVTAVRAERGGTAEAAVTAAWADLDDALCDYGMAREPSESPRALARRLARQYGFDAEATASVTRIATSVERLLFARTPGGTGPMSEDVRRVRRALAATVSRGRRIRAVLLPPSTLLRIRVAGARVLDGFDRLGNIRLRLPARRDA
jgi:transglutaminase-like putative cysteine protease